MRLTPDDILNQRFKTKFQGLDKDDVMTYLQLVADDFEIFQEETAKLKDQLGKQDQILKKYKGREDKVRAYAETLSKDKGNLHNEDAIKKGDEIIQKALDRAKEINEEAIKKGDEMIQKALGRAKEIKVLTEREIYNMEKEILMLEKHKKGLMESVK